MIHFHPLRVKKVEKETDDCVSIEFDVPGTLQETFRFKQGQTLAVKKVLNGQELRRNYSICSSPLDNKLKVAVKKVEGGLFSAYANEDLKAGDFLDVLPPSGKFYTDLHPANKKSYVAFAAGSGITPLLSIVKTTLLTEPQSNFTLVYGNRSKSSILFKEELEALKDKFMNRFRIYHILSRERTDVALTYGRIDVPKLETLFGKLIDAERCDEFFLCGPEAMVFCVRHFLLGRNVAPDKIHFELFTVPGQDKKWTVGSGQEATATDQRPTASVTVKVDGIAFDFPLAYESESILDAALKQGADLPYACKGGVCTTCKAMLLEGEVSMDVNWGLEPDEVAQGFVLTCQAHPVSETVVVNFDVK